MQRTDQRSTGTGEAIVARELIAETQALGYCSTCQRWSMRTGFGVRIYGPPREHPPAHVHIDKTGLVVIRLGTPETPPKVWRVYDMKDRDVLKAYRIVEKHHERIQQAWRAIHG